MGDTNDNLIYSNVHRRSTDYGKNMCFHRAPARKAEILPFLSPVRRLLSTHVLPGCAD